MEPIEWAYENIGEITSKGQLNNMADFLAAKQLDLVINLPMRHGGARRVSSFNTHGKSPAHSISVIIGAVLSACLFKKKWLSSVFYCLLIVAFIAFIAFLTLERYFEKQSATLLNLMFYESRSLNLVILETI